MKDSKTIKNRLKTIQKYFNPEKNTYKLIATVVNNDLTYDQMLMELSKIKGFSKYPEDLKKEYISIINDIKENIIEQRKKEEEERKEANTKELKDIIDSLEKTKSLYLKKEDDNNEVEELDNEEDTKEDNSEVKYERTSLENKTQVELEDKKKKEKSEEKKLEKDKDDKEDDLGEVDSKIIKTRKVLILGIALMIIIIILALIFY